MAIIGYMRVSTTHQKFDSQEKSLNDFGVETIFKEYESEKNKSK
ncbi:MAG: recombinase family protein [Vagococcus salmoninarum]